MQRTVCKAVLHTYLCLLLMDGSILQACRALRRDVLRMCRSLLDTRAVHGGADSGPMPTELLLAALGSCMCLAVAHVARKRRIALTTLRVEVDADKDMEAFRFREIALLIRADLPEEQLAPLVEQARRYCFVSNTVAMGCAIQYTTESLPTLTSGAESLPALVSGAEA